MEHRIKAEFKLPEHCDRERAHRDEFRNPEILNSFGIFGIALGFMKSNQDSTGHDSMLLNGGESQYIIDNYI